MFDKTTNPRCKYFGVDLSSLCGAGASSVEEVH